MRILTAIATTDDQIVNTNSLSGLELAKYVLSRLTNDQNTIEKIADSPLVIRSD